MPIERNISDRQLDSFPLFGIEAHGLVRSLYFVLGSYAEREERGELVRRYMQRTDFAVGRRHWRVDETRTVCWF